MSRGVKGRSLVSLSPPSHRPDLSDDIVLPSFPFPPLLMLFLVRGEGGYGEGGACGGGGEGGGASVERYAHRRGGERKICSRRSFPPTHRK